MLSDLDLKAKVRDPVRLMERALLWLHEQDILRLNKRTGSLPTSHDDPS